MLLSLLLGFIGLVLIFSSQLKKSRKKYKRLGVIFFITTFIIYGSGFGFLEIYKRSVRKELLSFINENSGQLQIMINDTIKGDSDLITKELSRFKSIAAHNSSPTGEIKIELKTNNEHRRLLLGQDSENKEEFWVYVLDFYITSLNEIGRIKSDYFLQFIPETEIDLRNKLNKDIQELENYFGLENLERQRISIIDTTKDDNYNNSQPYNKIRLTYKPTGKIAVGKSHSDIDKNYLEALRILKENINSK